MNQPEPNQPEPNQPEPNQPEPNQPEPNQPVPNEAGQNLTAAAARASAALLEATQSVAVAESSAGGLISSALLAVPGASRYFAGGGVVYTSASKQTLMAIPDEIMQADRAATEAHALALARAARQRLGADWGIGETGAAGPTGNRYGDAPGHCCIAVSGTREAALTLSTGSDDRAANMQAFAAAALDLLAETVRGSAR
jgi:nicotinamide-nucleotide amidase